MKVLVFGNPLVEKDSLVLKMLPELRRRFPEIEFQEVDPTEGLEKHGRDLIILDAVEDIKEVMVIDLVEQLKTNKIYSMHDFDLAYNLKILKKLKLIDSIKIIGIPMEIGEEKALNQIQLILRKCAAQVMQGS